MRKAEFDRQHPTLLREDYESDSELKTTSYPQSIGCSSKSSFKIQPKFQKNSPVVSKEAQQKVKKRPKGPVLARFDPLLHMNLRPEEKENLDKIHEYKTGYQWFIKISRLLTGASFGELALLNDQPRAATIQCLSDVYVAVLSKNDYQRVFERGEQKQQNRKFEFFHQVHHLKHLSKNMLKVKLLPCFVLKYYQINQVVFAQGSQAKNVFVTVDGEFEIVKRVKDT